MHSLRFPCSLLFACASYFNRGGDNGELCRCRMPTSKIVDLRHRLAVGENVMVHVDESHGGGNEDRFPVSTKPRVQDYSTDLELSKVLRKSDLVHIDESCAICEGLTSSVNDPHVHRTTSRTWNCRKPWKPVRLRVL